MATRKTQQEVRRGQQPAEAGEDRPEATRRAPVFTPPTDIYETENALVLLVEMAGVQPDSVEVTLEKRVLTIRGQNKGAQPDGYTLAHAEYRDGNYERAFTLSEAIDPERIEARMRDGVLTLTLPKAGPAEAKSIQVQAG